MLRYLVVSYVIATVKMTVIFQMFGPYSHYYNGMMVGMPHQNPVPPTAHHPNPHQLSGHQPSHSWNQNQGFLNSGKIILGKSLANVVSFYKDFTNADSNNADSIKAA